MQSIFVVFSGFRKSPEVWHGLTHEQCGKLKIRQMHFGEGFFGLKTWCAKGDYPQPSLTLS